jgi:hypothetical protein
LYVIGTGESQVQLPRPPLNPLALAGGIMPETILDQASIEGLLQMASEEGLLRDRKDQGDLLLAGLRQRSFPDWHRQQILEQVLINSKIHTLWEVPFDDLEGDFLALNFVQFEKGRSNLSTEDKAIAPEIIEGLLRARGYERPFYEWVPLFEIFQEVLKRVELYELSHPGTEFNALSAWIRGMVDREFRNSEEYLLVDKWNEAYKPIQPLISAVDEFLKLSNFATSTTQYLRTPLYRMSPNLFNLKPDIATDTPVVHVYRIVTEQLGVIPICTSLRHVLALAQDSDAVSLRNRMDDWLQSLASDSADITTRIQTDIAKASNSLVKARSLKMAGRIVGYILIPTSAIGIVNSLLGALGFGLTCVAVILDQSGRSLERHVSWMGFGTSRAIG